MKEVGLRNVVPFYALGNSFGAVGYEHDNPSLFLTKSPVMLGTPSVLIPNDTAVNQAIARLISKHRLLSPVIQELCNCLRPVTKSVSSSEPVHCTS